MSQVPLSQAPHSGPPKTLPDELIKAIQSDAFQIFLEQEAERRILVVLKRLALFATPFLLALGFFGWKSSQLYGQLQDASRQVKADAREVAEHARRVAEQSGSAEDARAAAERSAKDVVKTAEGAQQSAGKVEAVKGQMEAISTTLALTAQMGTATADKLLSTAATTSNELENSRRQLKDARNEVDTLKGELNEKLKDVAKLSRAVEDLNRASVLRVALLRDHSTRPFELPDPKAPEQSWRLVFRTARMGLTKPWKLAWTYEKLSASGARETEGRPIEIDRTLQAPTTGPLEGTPFWYRVDLAYHSFFAEDFIALSIYAPNPPAAQSTN